MSSNILIKIVAGVLLVMGVGVVAFKMNAGDEVRVAEDVPAIGGAAIDEATRAALGIEADTPEDVVKTLISSVRESNAKMRELELTNQDLRDQNGRLLGMESNLSQKMAAQLQTRMNELTTSNSSELANTKRGMQQLFEQFRSNAGNASTPAAAPPTFSMTQPGATMDSQGTVWIPPLGVASEGHGASLLNHQGLSTLPFDRHTKGTSNRIGGGNLPVAYHAEYPEIPAYTLAKNSTLVGATAFTALVGRVPVGENVVDPYSFKVIIGKDNLIANGKKVPELSYAVVSGKAIGDWTLSCVSGKVFSITFVFEDGRIRTLPKPKDISDGSQKTQDLEIGELSDDFGNPCVVGKKISNAGKYLAQRVIATAAEAAARAAAAAQTTTTVSGFGGLGVGGTTIVDGNTGKFILDESLAGAANEAAQWVRDRQALEFDAIYVRPGAKVAIHITEELRIDYEQEGRLTQYSGFALRGRHRELD